jgi:dUTPase
VQVVPMPNLADGMQPVRKSQIDAETSRGTNGFGSTGRR